MNWIETPVKNDKLNLDSLFISEKCTSKEWDHSTCKKLDEDGD